MSERETARDTHDRAAGERMVPAWNEEQVIMPIEGPLLDLLACPIDKQGLLYFEDEGILYNPRLRRIYRTADDHVVMLPARAEPAPEHEHERLLKRARHGDAVGTAGLRVDGAALEGNDR